MANVRASAEDLASKMREVSVAEFFEKNRHLLGYENPSKALLTIVKELVDNSLDAANEADMTPTIKISIKQSGENRFKITSEDDGPGMVEDKIGLAFGKLLYGSKFHRLRQSRGTQGIGVSGAIMYSQLTTGKPTKILSSTGKGKIHEVDIMIDVSRNEPKIVSHKELDNPKKWHGIKISMEAEGRYTEGKQSVAEYMKQTAVANPYAKIIYDGPNGKTTFEKVTNDIPVQPKEIKPHPYGVEVGVLRRMVNSTKARNVVGFLIGDFSRVGRNSATQICKAAKIESSRKPSTLSHDELNRLHEAMQEAKLIAPPTDVLSPLGEKLIEEGLKKEVDAEFFVAVSRPPAVYRGNPFLVEVGLAYGGKLHPESNAQIMRFANKVPLLYHQGDCATLESIGETDWRRYGFSQSNGSPPQGPLVILIHFASVWVPYTSEGKQAIADYPEIVKEMKLALQEAGRRLAIYVRRRKKLHDRQMRRQIFERYIPEVARALGNLTGKDEKKIAEDLEVITKKNVKISEDEERDLEEKENGEGDKEKA